MPYQTTRRNVVRGVAGAGVGLSVLGTTATAEETERFVVAANRSYGEPGKDLEESGFEIVAEIDAADVLVVDGPAGSYEELLNRESVTGAAPDLEYELDPIEEGDQPEYHPSPEVTRWDKEVTDAFEAHEIATGEGTTLGIIDTGVDADHPDMTNLNVDKSRTFLDGEELPHMGDRNYHGTHVAGTVGASGAGRGIVRSEHDSYESDIYDPYYCPEDDEVGEPLLGTAPDTELVDLRVFPDTGGAPISNSFMALDYAAENGFDAVNMSIGSPPQPPQDNRDATRHGFRVSRERVVQSVVQRGTTVVTSAGNAGRNLQQGGWLSLWGSLEHTISVSATLHPSYDETLAPFSNYGTGEIDVGAPGGGVLSAYRYPAMEDRGFCQPYWYASGTSMAAPQVTGLVGLVKELEPDLNPHQVERAIKRGAELSEGESDPELGAGRINALNTVESLQ